MSGFRSALRVEALKARRSKLSWLTSLGFSLAPLVGGLFMLVLKDPEWARNFGLISAKAQITTGTADWPAYFDLLAQAVAVGGLIVFGLVASWEFGREYSDQTVADILALPTSREMIVLAKFSVIALWSVTLTSIVYTLGLATGMLVGLPGWSYSLAVESAGQVVLMAILTILLVTPFAWAASAGRGYMPAIGTIILAVVFSQIVAALGWGAYFPWSIPALLSSVAGSENQEITAISYLIVGFTGIAGLTGTIAWWRFADQI